ncbi:MAG: VaFE repeat-containing surface-anchored protein [Clostridiales bacterium]|nr:VaFE repeat-containing surface-anchored protein [Clostridiales bacterium]
MKKTKKNIIRSVAAAIATVIAMSPIVSNARVAAWGTPISSGNIKMTHNSKCAQLFNSVDTSVDRNCNAKSVLKDGHWVPVYCIEKGKYLNDSDSVKAEMYNNSAWCSQYNMTVRDALGMIYVCGYNGENGWGSIDTSIFDHDADDATLMANSNYHKYVATQALIWEITNDTTYYSRSSAVQGEIDVLRSRIRNYQNREVRAANATGSISVYKSASEAQAHAYGATSVESGVGHFAYGYNSYYNPTNFIEETNWNIVTNKTANDFTTSIVDKKITLGWTRVYGSSAEVGQSGQTIYNLDDNDASNLWGVVLWRPDNGNQLTISATATSDKVYASFVFDFQRETFQAAATLNTVKVDEQGNPSRGATFTVYKADGSAFGTMTDANKDGQYSFSIPRTEFADEDGHYYDSDNNGKPITTPINRTYTVKETSPATEVYINGAWQKATFAANDTTYTISISIDRATGKMTWTATGTNGGSADRAGRTTAGNISFGSVSQNGKTVNYQLVSADADFTIKKVDELGLEAKGATFGVYSDPDCTSISFMTLTDPDGDGIFTSSVLSWKDQLKSSGAKSQVLYIKERTPATQVRINGKWVDATCELDPSVKTLRIVWNPADGNIYEELYNGAVTDFKSTKPKITKSGTFDGSKSTVHADFTSDPWVNVPYVYAKADLTIKKVDNQGRQARGAEFTVYSDEVCTKKVGTMTDKSKDGIYIFENISFTKKLRNVNTVQTLTYYVKETKPASEILFDGKWIAIDCKLDSKVQKITITWTPSNGSIKAVLSKDGEKDITVNGAFDEKTLTSTVHADFTGRPVVNPITSTGSMKIEKYDAETGERLPGATFRVYYDQNDNGLYDSPDTVYLEALTDEDGDGIYLLEGMPLDKSYLVIETEAPEYYETDPNYYSFKLTPSKRDVTVDNVTWKVVEGVPGEFLNHNPIIGTTLVDKETEEHVTVVREKITLIDTVEYNGLHVGEKYVMTGTLYDRATCDPILDANGNPITGSVTFVPEKVSGTVEVPFEINTEIARNKTIVAGEKVRHEESEKWVGIHFNLKDQGQTVFVPDLHTTLTDKNTEDHVAADETVELIDVVSYENLVPGLEYTVVGKLMDKKTGESLKDKAGKEITSSVTFTPEKREGTVEVVFSFTRAIAEDTVIVAFEDLYYKEVLVVSHADIEDVDQTVYFPKIQTSLVGAGTKEHVVPQAEEITLVDTVTYSNLLPGKTYTLTGTLMNKDTGEPLKDKDGKAITSTVVFVAEKAEGTVDVVFTFDSSLLNGSTIVAFEDLEYEKIKIATHADIKDKDQTVKVPDIKTTLFDKDLAEDHEMREMTRENAIVTLVDTVAYKNLIPNLEYTVVGTLMVKETGEALLDQDGNPVTAAATFKPEKSEGTVEVEFTVDTTGLENKHLVAFETLMYKDETLVIHADIEDVDQTVRVPDIGTTLLDSETDSHISPIGETITLVDTVSYKGLVVGKTYTVSGTLYDKETGEPILDKDGKEITASKEFVAETKDGSVEVEFTLDSSLLQSKKVVAFEKVLYLGREVATHMDLEDEEQTVIFPEIGTTATVEGKKEFYPEELVVLTDTVSFENLIPGHVYELCGTVMKTDGSAFAPAGLPLTSVIRFIPETEEGTVDVEFRFNASSLKKGDQLVVFEKLYLVEVVRSEDGQGVEKKILLTTHEDLTDKGQTVTVKPWLPKTGEEDATGNILIGLIAICMGGAIAFVVIKKKKDE